MDSVIIEPDEREALASLVPAHPLPPRKTHSYVEQCEQKPHHPIRKYSLDEGSRSVTSDSEAVYFDSSDGEFSTEGVAIVDGRTSGERGNGEECGFVTPPSKPASQGGGNDGGREDDIESLPEFIGAGGGLDVFKVPVRAAVNPGRPPCLELRPHPLRETQTGKFLRNIACTESQLWAGQENGVRFWNLEEAYEVGCGLGGQVRRGDEDTAPFHESVPTSPALCLLVDHGNRLVWTGHKDGKIRAWKMNQPNTTTADDSKPFKERLSWQAHRGPVNYIVISSYG